MSKAKPKGHDAIAPEACDCWTCRLGVATYPPPRKGDE